jgi:hypothetical protein
VRHQRHVERRRRAVVLLDGIPAAERFGAVGQRSDGAAEETGGVEPAAAALGV